MSSHNREKTHPILLFLPLVLISYIVFWVFSDQFDKGFYDSVNSEHKPSKKEEKIVENKFNINDRTDESIKVGRKIYSTTCVTCHGKEGRGDGTKSNPMPRNFYNASDFKFGTSFEKLFETVTKGSPGTSMAPFGYLPEDDRIAVSHYISRWVPGSKSDNASELIEASSSDTPSNEPVKATKKDIKIDDSVIDNVIDKVSK